MIAFHVRLLVLLVVAASMGATAATNAQQVRRYIVQFKTDVAFDDFRNDYNDDGRFSASARNSR